MVGFVFGAFGAFIRWIFIYNLNSKKMGEAYNTNPQVEDAKNSYAGLFLVPLGIIVGIFIKY
ncbi:hypothetical protein H1R16_07100 [Marnyiella aurantia]|uniref:Uncharacterized protein n=1 Tax=Marnyiella aurantia TaxID=2758037 RepID=A0A7D7LQM1_9FLAO|nr:hypothetical protein [Marnyiella aurantia]MBA5247174.1 hypothetical protein [Marnyiella aurantia]QMS97497.1 hypothetical protein H1R16_07100 [Marnyiella aurantia]